MTKKLPRRWAKRVVVYDATDATASSRDTSGMSGSARDETQRVGSADAPVPSQAPPSSAMGRAVRSSETSSPEREAFSDLAPGASRTVSTAMVPERSEASPTVVSRRRRIVSFDPGLSPAASSSEPRRAVASRAGATRRSTEPSRAVEPSRPGQMPHTGKASHSVASGVVVPDHVPSNREFTVAGTNGGLAAGPPSNREALRDGAGRAVVPSGVVPSGVVPSGVMPSGVMPSGVMPSGGSSSGALSSGALARAPVAVAAPTARALVVDDDPEIRRALARLLRPELDVHLAGTVAQAEALLERLDRVDVAFIDWELPDGTGEQILERLAHWPDAIRVLISARVSSSENPLKDRSLANLVLGKPLALGVIDALKRAALALPHD